MNSRPLSRVSEAQSSVVSMCRHYSEDIRFQFLVIKYSLKYVEAKINKICTTDISILVLKTKLSTFIGIIRTRNINYKKKKKKYTHRTIFFSLHSRYKERLNENIRHENVYVYIYR